MLKDSANIAIRPISLNIVNTKPEWRCVDQSKNSHGSKIATTIAASHGQWRRRTVAKPGAAMVRRVMSALMCREFPSGRVA